MPLDPATPLYQSVAMLIYRWMKNRPDFAPLKMFYIDADQAVNYSKSKINIFVPIRQEMIMNGVVYKHHIYRCYRYINWYIYYLLCPCPAYLILPYALDHATKIIELLFFQTAVS